MLGIYPAPYRARFCNSCPRRRSKNKNRSIKGWNGHPALQRAPPQLAVSPFDGASRIRFKGSPRLPIANLRLPIGFVTKSQSAIDNRQCFGLSASVTFQLRLPRNGSNCQCINSKPMCRACKPNLRRAPGPLRGESKAPPSLRSVGALQSIIPLLFEGRIFPEKTQWRGLPRTVTRK